MSGAVYQMLHVVEIVLRNAVDDRLRTWNSAQSDPRTGLQHDAAWLLDPSRLVERLVRREEIDKAIQRARLATREASRGLRSFMHDDVLAQLSFGTWRFLLPDRDPGRRRLWADALSTGFPHLDRPVRALVDDVDRLYRLRNRVAHLEPLLETGSVVSHVRAARRVLRDIEPAAEKWLVSQQRVTTLAQRKPLEMPNGPTR